MGVRVRPAASRLAMRVRGGFGKQRADAPFGFENLLLHSLRDGVPADAVGL